MSEEKRKWLVGLDATQLKYLTSQMKRKKNRILQEEEKRVTGTDIPEIALVDRLLDALEEAKKSSIRVKFGWNLFSQPFTCARCQKEFENTRDHFSLLLRLEVLGAMMDFPICPACVEKYGLFEGEVTIRNNRSHYIGIA